MCIFFQMESKIKIAEERAVESAEERGRRRDTVEQKVGAKGGGMPQPPVPRASKLLKQAKNDASGFRGEKEFVEVDINRKEIFCTVTKQDLPTGFGA